MKIIITAGEAIEKGYWEKVCKWRGWNVWSFNEGLMDRKETIELTEWEANELGILCDRRENENTM